MAKAKKGTKKAARRPAKQSVKRRAGPVTDLTRNALTATEKRNVAVLRKMYRDFGNPALPGEVRLKAVMDCLHEDTLIHEHAAPSVITWGGKHKGKQGWQNFLAAIATKLDHGAYVCQHIQPSGEWSFAWGYLETKTRDTGRSARNEWQHRLRMKNGKIVKLHEFYDTLQAALDLGWIKA